MKQKIAALLACTMLLTSVMILPSCDSDDGKDQQVQGDNTAVTLLKDGQAIYSIVRPQTLARNSDLMKAATSLKSSLADADSYTDNKNTNTKEILLGNTDREETRQVLSELAFNEFAIKVVGDKIVICGASDSITAQGVNYFIENYITADSTTITLAADLSVKQAADLSVSSVHNLSYDDMAKIAYDAYTDNKFGGGSLPNTEFWDAAEILEAYLDAYEQTLDPQYLTNAEDIAKKKFGGGNSRTDWCRNNAYNDDIAWACIGFARLYMFTGNATYAAISKNNFDIMWERAYSPDVLGGGLWWKDDQKDTKNSCIQCPASIAACLLGQVTGDDGYYEKAKELMEWEFENLFIAEGDNAGRVYDAKRTNGEFNTWASTYNQGTFVGACMLLHEKYGDQKYLDYADLAVQYGMTKLGNVGGVLNCEADGNDLIGFKGILTRWFYRYAEYTENLDILYWLQKNADTAFGNRNSDNLIWTDWTQKTNEQDYDPWGLSAAIALLHNCQPWW